ncbi:lipoprotein [Thiofaba sp. EF100]
MHTPHRLWAGLIVLVLGLSACGQKGDLYRSDTLAGQGGAKEGMVEKTVR